MLYVHYVFITCFSFHTVCMYLGNKKHDLMFLYSYSTEKMKVLVCWNQWLCSDQTGSRCWCSLTVGLSCGHSLTPSVTLWTFWCSHLHRIQLCWDFSLNLFQNRVCSTWKLQIEVLFFIMLLKKLTRPEVCFKFLYKFFLFIFYI